MLSFKEFSYMLNEGHEEIGSGEIAIICFFNNESPYSGYNFQNNASGRSHFIEKIESAIKETGPAYGGLFSPKNRNITADTPSVLEITYNFTSGAIFDRIDKIIDDISKILAKQFSPRVVTFNISWNAGGQ